MVVDDTRGIETPDNRFRPQGTRRVQLPPQITRGQDAVDHVRVHVFVVPGCIVARGVHHDRRMVLGGTHVEFRVPGVSVVLVGIGRPPLVLAEMGLGKGYEHPYVIRGSQDLRKPQVGARLAAIIVSVDEIDAK